MTKQIIKIDTSEVRLIKDITNYKLKHPREHFLNEKIEITNNNDKKVILNSNIEINQKNNDIEIISKKKDFDGILGKFNYLDSDIVIIKENDDEYWLKAVEIAKLFGYVNTNNAIKKHVDFD